MDTKPCGCRDYGGLSQGSHGAAEEAGLQLGSCKTHRTRRGWDHWPPPHRGLHPSSEVVDCPTQLIYIWFFLCWVGGGNPSRYVAKCLSAYFGQEWAIWTIFFCKISMFDIWRLDLCDRFLPGCSHLTAGRLFLQTMSSSFEDFPRFRKFLVSGFSSFQEIPRFRNSSFQEFLISGFSWNEEILQIEKAAAKTTEPRAATILNVKLEHYKNWEENLEEYQEEYFLVCTIFYSEVLEMKPIGHNVFGSLRR